VLIPWGLVWGSRSGGVSSSAPYVHSLSLPLFRKAPSPPSELFKRARHITSLRRSYQDLQITSERTQRSSGVFPMHPVVGCGAHMEWELGNWRSGNAAEAQGQQARQGGGLGGNRPSVLCVCVWGGAAPPPPPRAGGWLADLIPRDVKRGGGPSEEGLQLLALLLACPSCAVAVLCTSVCCCVLPCLRAPCLASAPRWGGRCWGISRGLVLVLAAGRPPLVRFYTILYLTIELWRICNNSGEACPSSLSSKA
jgi:hypothetical protein